MVAPVLRNWPTVTINQLQLLVEQDKIALAREIHDRHRRSPRLVVTLRSNFSVTEWTQ
jgi:hypothetical protein